MLAFVDGVHFKYEVQVPLHRNNQHLYSHESGYDHHRVSIDNEMTTPKGFHYDICQTENPVGFLISDLL